MENYLQTIGHPVIRNILKCYQDAAKKDHINTFNVFTLTSDLYYRENYHSDILKAFLEYRGNRTGKYPLLESFINMVKDSRGEMKVENYARPIIERESHRIDILIKNKDNNHCIIIENKINDAPDMERQLPRYYDQTKEENLIIDAVVYITKYPDLLPDKIGWSEDDEQKISNVFVSLPVEDVRNRLSLINWIENSTWEINDADVLSALRQYRQLLKKIVGQMSELNPIMKLNSVLQQSKYPNIKLEDIIDLRDMLNHLPTAMAFELKKKLSGLHLKNTISHWEPNSCVIQLPDEDRIYVYCELNIKSGYKVFAADFSIPSRSPTWIDRENLDEYKSRLISNEFNKGIGFQFSYYESEEVIKLIQYLLEIYNHNKS